MNVPSSSGVKFESEARGIEYLHIPQVFAVEIEQAQPPTRSADHDGVGHDRHLQWLLKLARPLPLAP